jgi:hypothetical protein
MLKNVADAPGTEMTVQPPEDVRALLDAVPGTLWDRLRKDPTRAPEHIALEAAKRFAPAAERWAAEHSGKAPGEAARLAVRRHVVLSRFEGAALGVGGAITAVPDLAALAWIQSRMTFFVAASYGYDPHHPMRPAELLALQEFFETPAQARAALDGLAAPMALTYIANRLQREEALGRQLVAYLGKRVSQRVFRRLIPFISMPVSAVQNSRATAELGNRALLYYGGDDRPYGAPAVAPESS